MLQSWASMKFVFKAQGRQYRCQPGAVLEVDRLANPPGSEVIFPSVMMVEDGDQLDLGQPYLKGVSVRAEVIENLRGPKLRIFKFRRRKKYRLTKGHRSELTKIKVIGVDGRSS